MIKDVQDGAFQEGGLSELGEHAGRHPAAAERAPVGVPPGDGRMQLPLLRLNPVRRAEAYPGEQQRLVWIRQQLDHRMAACHGHGQPHVEERRAAGDVHGAAARVAIRQCTLWVGPQFNGLSLPQHPESPWLRIVHGGRCYRCFKHISDQLLRQLSRLGWPRRLARV